MLTHSHLLTSKHKVSLTVFVSLLSIILLSVTSSQGQTPTAEEPVIVTLPPSDSMSVVVEGYCLDYSLPFPGPEITPSSLAAPAVRLAIAHSIAKGYTQSDPYQVQLAIWYLRDGEWHDEDHDLAAAIVDQAQSGAQPPDTDLEGTPLPEAVSNGTISATVSDFQAVSSPAYKGQGTLEIVNLTSSEQVINFPYGTVFEAEPSLNVQNMVVYAVQEPSTPTPASTPTPTSTPTQTPTSTPTPLPPATSTPEPPTSTPTPTGEPILPPSGASQTSGLSWAGGILLIGGMLIAAGFHLLCRKQLGKKQ